MAGSKCHLVVDRNGILLAVHRSAADAHDSTRLVPLVDTIPPILVAEENRVGPGKGDEQGVALRVRSPCGPVARG